MVTRQGATTGGRLQFGAEAPLNGWLSKKLLHIQNENGQAGQLGK